MQRRDWIKNVLVGACTPLSALQYAPLLAATQTGRRLVLVELAGANDGLNTLVPIRNDHYHALRPTLSLTPQEVIDLQDDYALHHKLAPLMDAWQNGEMAWVHGLGYPEPNRSHFKSIALWESGGDGLQQGRQGWLTHDIQHSLGRTISDAHGISLVNDMSLFNSDSGRWLSMTNPNQFAMKRLPVNTQAASVNASLASVTARMQELDRSLIAMQKRLASVPTAPGISGGRLGKQLQQVVQLIRADIDTPVYRVQLPGFDTHKNQLGRHANLLSQLAESLAGFRQVLQDDGEWDNTLVLTYSEFGRRAEENRSGGTDHGTAAPHMLLGGKLTGGLYGQAPDLSELNYGDPAFTMDYRSVYASVLSNWFAINEHQFSHYRNTELASMLRPA